MKNYHSNEYILNRVQGHYNEALKLYEKDKIVGVFLQGSQNYGLEIENSDVDTKCIIVPSFMDICLNKPPVSTTHILKYAEHLDAKDIRNYCACFRKQNLNFLEILFTPFTMITPMYFDQWNRLIQERESIARMNPWRAVKSMKGIALEKYHAMEHRYPSKLELIDKYGYDCKQLHHLVRVDNYLTRYITGESYESCLIPEERMKEFLLDIKQNKYDLAAARSLAELSLAHVEKIANEFCEKTHDEEDPIMRELLEDVSYNIMKIVVEEELKNG